MSLLQDIPSLCAETGRRCMVLKKHLQWLCMQACLYKACLLATMPPLWLQVYTVLLWQCAWHICVTLWWGWRLLGMTLTLYASFLSPPGIVCCCLCCIGTFTAKLAKNAHQTIRCKVLECSHSLLYAIQFTSPHECVVTSWLLREVHCC